MKVKKMVRNGHTNGTTGMQVDTYSLGRRLAAFDRISLAQTDE
jgi:hypothetical protein